ncbi:MAG: hypothetical protein LN413_00205 [Candidatus Thermoplasmatota archaeon]|nr:hypothetical protein [Candidatus Thermoplasmatota archaeon]
MASQKCATPNCTNILEGDDFAFAAAFSPDSEERVTQGVVDGTGLYCEECQDKQELDERG